jgi:hypothetical protein
MMRPTPQKQSRSLRLYARLLELYPPAFLQQHRAEMLQNFADLENATPSKVQLWLLIGKDLTMSLMSQFFASQLGNYVIAAVTVWILIFVIGYFTRGSTPGYPALHAFGGFLLGMLSMYIAARLYESLQGSPYLIGGLVACLVLFTIGYLRYPTTPGRPVWQVIGGALLGMLAMSIAIRLYGMHSSRHA